MSDLLVMFSFLSHVFIHWLVEFMFWLIVCLIECLVVWLSIDCKAWIIEFDLESFRILWFWFWLIWLIHWINWLIDWLKSDIWLHGWFIEIDLIILIEIIYCICFVCVCDFIDLIEFCMFDWLHDWLTD